MPQPFNTGPVLWFFGFSTLPFEYFGTIEGPTEPDFDPQYEPVYNDLTGTRLPFDLLIEGEQAFISGSFTNWQESLYSRLAAQTGNDPLGSRRGVTGPREIGTLMVLEKETFRLALVYPYSYPGCLAYKPAMANQVPGYVFANCVKVKHRRRGGTGANKLFVAIHAITANRLLYSVTPTSLPSAAMVNQVLLNPTAA